MFENCPAKKRILKEEAFTNKCKEIWEMFRNEGLFNARNSVIKYCDKKIAEGNTEFNWDYMKFKIIESNTGGE